MNRSLWSLRVLGAGVALALLTGVGSPASANEYFSLNNTLAGDNGSISFNGGSVSTTAGVYQAYSGGTNNSNLVDVLCVDPTHTIQWGNNGYTDNRHNLVQNAPTQADWWGNPTDNSGNPANYKADAANAISYLVNQAMSNVNSISNDQAATDQLAIWKITQDGQTGNTFSWSGFNNISQATVQSLINQAYNASANQQATWFQVYDSHGNDGGAQDFGGAPVLPEPAFYQMSALLGLGGIGWLRRRKQA